MTGAELGSLKSFIGFYNDAIHASSEYPIPFAAIKQVAEARLVVRDAEEAERQRRTDNVSLYREIV